MVLALDEGSNSALDSIFLLITHLGEIWGALLVLLVVLFVSGRKYIPFMVVCILFSTLASQSLKHTFFEHERRPSYTYTELHPVEGLERHKNNSFPSGHTTAAFTFMSLLAIGIPRKGVQIAAPLIGSLVAVSRLYLGQHYLHDVVVGAILGLLLTAFITHIFEKYNWIK